MTFVGVCGGRNFSDRLLLADVLEQEIKAGDVIVHGGAVGADSEAGRWAEHNSIQTIIVPALWGVFGRSAGMRRNAVIAALPLRLLIAFPGGIGTAGMILLASKCGVEVHEVMRDGKAGT